MRSTGIWCRNSCGKRIPLGVGRVRVFVLVEVNHVRLTGWAVEL